MDLIKKYQKYISNIEWHIRVNKPEVEELKRCNEMLKCYNEIVEDLSEHPTPTVSAEEVLEMLFKQVYQYIQWETSNTDVKPDFQKCHDAMDAYNVWLGNQSRFRTPAPEGDYQSRVNDWMQVCFGSEISDDIKERNHRFFEEATELVQSTGITKSECHQLVDYVFNRPVGETKQEVGGVVVTLAALCNALRISTTECGETELTRINGKVEQIRAKQAAKPKHSPLPEAPAPADSLDATAEEIKEGLQNSYWKETGEFSNDSYLRYAEWLEDKIAEYRQYVGVPVGGVEELEMLAEQEFRNYKMKNDSYWYCFKDGFISGYQHKPAKVCDCSMEGSMHRKEFGGKYCTSCGGYVPLPTPPKQ